MQSCDIACTVPVGQGVSFSWHLEAAGGPVSLELRVPPGISDKTIDWIALGAVSPTGVGDNFMTGPPASAAVIGRPEHKNPVILMSLDEMASPPGIEQPWTGIAKVVASSDGARLLNFSASRIGAYQLLGRSSPLRMIWGVGTCSDDGTPQYHGSHKNYFDVDLNKHGAEAVVVSELDMIMDARTLRSIHGASMALIWGFLTLIGSGFARYMRHKPYWFTVHKLCQSIASVLTLPVMYLAYVSKPEKNYGTVHGKVGLAIGIASSAQGLLGTLAVRSHRHFCGMSNPPWFDDMVRACHRIIGLMLLVTASVQIGLGLESFSPPIIGKNDMLPWAGPTYLAWTGLIWCTIIVMELGMSKGPWDYWKCRRKRNLPYDPVKGTGFMTEIDIKIDQSAYFALKNVVKRTMDSVSIHLQQEADADICGSCQKANCKRNIRKCLVYEWTKSCSHGIVGQIKLVLIPPSIKFWRGYESMSTKDLFSFARWCIQRCKDSLQKVKAKASVEISVELSKLEKALNHVVKISAVNQKASSMVHPSPITFQNDRASSFDKLSRRRLSTWSLEPQGKSGSESSAASDEVAAQVKSWS